MLHSAYKEHDRTMKSKGYQKLNSPVQEMENILLQGAKRPAVQRKLCCYAILNEFTIF